MKNHTPKARPENAAKIDAEQRRLAVTTPVPNLHIMQAERSNDSNGNAYILIKSLLWNERVRQPYRDEVKTDTKEQALTELAARGYTVISTGYNGATNAVILAVAEMRRLKESPHGTPQAPEPVQEIEVRGKRWFSRTYGNTYHTASIYVNGEYLHTTERTYGYNDCYLQTAQEWLTKNGYTPDMPHNTPLWTYCSERKIKLKYSAQDVAREKDL